MIIFNIFILGLNFISTYKIINNENEIFYVILSVLANKMYSSKLKEHKNAANRKKVLMSEGKITKF